MTGRLFKRECFNIQIQTSEPTSSNEDLSKPLTHEPSDWLASLFSPWLVVLAHERRYLPALTLQGGGGWVGPGPTSPWCCPQRRKETHKNIAETDAYQTKTHTHKKTYVGESRSLEWRTH
jgi:hypothetical protein